jgi:flavin reductase (DIM6/NTAB) family NADH-FMN oxidoreductase RutF
MFTAKQNQFGRNNGMSEDIKKVLRKLEYGVYVVTMGKGHEGNAFTASWLTQVSSEPPMIALAVNNSHQSARLLNEHNSFVVHLIDDAQIEFAKTYYGPAESGYDKLRSKEISESPATGTPLFKGAAGYLDCQIIKRIPAGNHTVYLGEVRAASLNQDVHILTTTASGLHYTG